MKVRLEVAQAWEDKGKKFGKRERETQECINCGSLFYPFRTSDREMIKCSKCFGYRKHAGKIHDYTEDIDFGEIPDIILKSHGPLEIVLGDYILEMEVVVEQVYTLSFYCEKTVKPDLIRAFLDDYTIETRYTRPNYKLLVQHKIRVNSRQYRRFKELGRPNYLLETWLNERRNNKDTK